MTDLDISDTLAPTSDQLDAVDLLGSPPRVFTITDVTRNNGEQPVNIRLAEFPRVWRPGKTMRRVLAGCWGKHADQWIGRRVELYCDETVKYGGVAVGGVRISRMSHLDGPKAVPIIVRQGQGGSYKVDPLPDVPTAPTKDWDAVLATALGMTDVNALGDLWRREGVGSAPAHVQDAIKARVAEIKAAVTSEDAFEKAGDQ